MLTFEYLINTISDGPSFNTVMGHYLSMRKTVENWTGYKHDLKEVNPNMLKKNTFRKSQMRTLIFHVGVPVLLFMMAGWVFFFVFLIFCCPKCCGAK